MICPDVATLQRFLDDGPSESDPARADIADHASECAECGARLREMEDRSARVRSWMEAHDPPTPDMVLAPRAPSTMGTRRRWAIAAGIVLAVALVAGPARAWIRATFAGDTPTEAVEPTRAEATTRFHVGAGELRVRFASASEGLHLSIVTGTDSLAALESPSAQGEIVVAPGSVEVRDPPSTGTYRLTLPAGVGTVVLERPGVPDTTLTIETGSTIEVALGSVSP